MAAKLEGGAGVGIGDGGAGGDDAWVGVDGAQQGAEGVARDAGVGVHEPDELGVEGGPLGLGETFAQREREGEAGGIAATAASVGVQPEMVDGQPRRSEIGQRLGGAVVYKDDAEVDAGAVEIGEIGEQRGGIGAAVVAGDDGGDAGDGGGRGRGVDFNLDGLGKAGD